jgi:hypothetical protein
MQAVWLLLYALVCGVEFVVDALKEFIGDRIRGKTKED